MRYDQSANVPSIALESPSQSTSGLLSLYPPPVINPNATATYSPDGSSYYSPSHIFPNLTRLGSNSTSSTTGMRSTALPHPGAQISAREQYSTSTPLFRRASERHPRSPSFPSSLRRHPLSPTTTSPHSNFTDTSKMDPNQYLRPPGSVPPLGPITTLGSLVYLDGSPGGVPIKMDIQGTIDKGFFQAEGEWTCYRRNYFSCVCSYSLTPYYPNQPMPMQYTQNGAQQSYTVVGFAMCISAVVADSDQTIDLVKHTPKRDKGPTTKPKKVRLLPKTPQTTTHHSLGLYGHDPSGLGGPSRMTYAVDPYPGTALPGDAYQTEHTFERIQFKQATANNGKRRAAQQYYHLLVELWADVGNQAPDGFIRIGHRKSAKMIVRGRSPGHYQNERRGSTSSGPGGSAGSMGGYGGSQMMSSDFASGNTMLSGGYGGAAFDSRGGIHYGGTRHHHDLPLELSIPPDEAKSIDTTKGYQYFPGSMYESSHQDGRGGVDMFTNGHRSGQEGVPSHMATGVDTGQDRTKKDAENGLLPSLFHPGPLVSGQRCGPFVSKPTSGGYYPTMPSQSGIDIPNII
ncbi:hypothetical protein ACRALDRAFT_2060290 [Sodiomyces alcalophilus JCM 7366]|uniref:uncharacterized protein n=1 Tax=Sodiomyces alcalophilus JCM 7366 TaxID=591952 RepID=UPI0039B375F3